MHFSKLKLTPTQVPPQLDTQNAHGLHNSAQHKGKFGREEGMERDSSLHGVQWKYLTLANCIKPYDHLNTLPEPSRALGGARVQDGSDASVSLNSRTTHPWSHVWRLSRMEGKLTSHWTEPNGTERTRAKPRAITCAQVPWWKWTAEPVRAWMQKSSLFPCTSLAPEPFTYGGGHLNGPGSRIIAIPRGIKSIPLSSPHMTSDGH